VRGGVGARSIGVRGVTVAGRDGRSSHSARQRGQPAADEGFEVAAQQLLELRRRGVLVDAGCARRRHRGGVSNQRRTASYWDRLASKSASSRSMRGFSVRR
jgi:hypothetical protein